MTTVTGLFDDYQDASDAVGKLKAIGVPQNNISGLRRTAAQP